MAEELDRYGISIPMPGGGEANPTLKDVTLGDLGKVIEDMSYGFYPVKGSGMTTQAKPEALELLNVPMVATAVVGAAKAAKAMPKAVAGAAVATGMTADNADAAPLSGMVAKAIRALSRTATKPEIEAAMLKADPKLNPEKAARYAARAEQLNKETSSLTPDTEIWSGRLGVVILGNPEMGGYHVMLEHRGDLLDIAQAGGGDATALQKASNVDLLKNALDVLEAAPAGKDGTRTIGKLSVKIVKNGPEKIGPFYIVKR